MNYMNKSSIKMRRRTILLMALLLAGGIASAQNVTIKGSVYGGGNLGAVRNVSTGTGTETNVTKIDSTTVYINGGTVKGTVYGGGKGTGYNENMGLVEGNASVYMKGGMVERSIYGGGEMGSVGTFTEHYTTATGGHLAGEPKTCYQGTGLAKVLLSGGQVGLNSTLMPTPQNPDDDFGYVFAACRGDADSLSNYNPEFDTLYNPYVDFMNRVSVSAVCNTSYLEIKGESVITASAYGGSENGMVMNGTHVKMMGGQIGVGLVSKELVDNQWEVTTNGPYFGTEWDGRWASAIEKIKNGTLTDADVTGWGFHGCDSWIYAAPYDAYDPYVGQPDPLYNPTNPDPLHPNATYHPANSSAEAGTNGHTYFGNLFGGGSGFYSFQPGVWRRTAGRVWGNVLVEIEGGHILSSVYGANETTDVMGKVTINMTGGTVGVPRTRADLENYPLTGYVYGAGKGDQRVWANKWTNVNETEVNITGGAIFGSVLGGGEDGHVLGNTKLTMSNIVADEAYHTEHSEVPVGTVLSSPTVGTWGFTGYDGNVFGGGRGFSPDALTAGAVCGNTEVNLTGVTILGSVFGGGRNGSVGIKLLDADDPQYGQMPEGNRGITKIRINNCIIGNDYESKLHRNATTNGGNVYGGSLGSIKLLSSNQVNPLWPMAAKVKKTDIVIDGASTIIKNNVYGGCGYGAVTDSTCLVVKNGTIWRNVYGGGLGSDDDNLAANYVSVQNNQTSTISVKPMRRAGRVEGNTHVYIQGGWVKKSVYGGGEFGSVGFYASEPVVHPEPTDWDDVTTGSPTHLSWPVGFEYVQGTGTTNVSITGGRIGITGKDYMGPWNADGQPIYYASSDVNQTTPIPYDLTTKEGRKALKKAREDNGDVYGAGQGEAGDRYRMATLCNVNNTVVTINQTTNADPDNYKPAKTSPLYLHDTLDFIYQYLPTYNSNVTGVTGTNWSTYGNLACIAGALYGGGENGHVNTNTNVTLTKGLIGHNLYGGGKGTDTYTVTLTHWNDGPTWTNGQEYSAKVTSITAGKVYGNTSVTMNGGCVVRNVYGGGNRASVGKANYASGPGDYYDRGYGEAWTATTQQETQDTLANSGHTYVYINHGQIGTADGMKDDFPTGNVYGSCRGEAADPTVPATLSPRFKYSPEFYLGYVNHTHVRIGETVSSTPTVPSENSPRLYGSVYGGGEDGHVRWGTHVEINDGEIGNAFTSTNPNDLTKVAWVARGNVYGAGSGLGKYKANDNDPGAYNYSSGSVTQNTTVTINGGVLHRNVYGGGSLAAVGPLKIYQPAEPTKAQSCNTVNINTTVSTEADFMAGYGGYVYGAGRGIDSVRTVNNVVTRAIDLSKFATSANTEVNLGPNALVYGNVYGGGELGQVRRDAEVNLNGGTIGLLHYCHKTNTLDSQPIDSVFHVLDCGRLFGAGKGVNTYRDAALVKGNTKVTINSGKVLNNVYGGGEVASVGERNITQEHSDPADETSPMVTTSITPKAGTGLAQVIIKGGEVGPAPKEEEGYNIPIALNSQDGYVFGGGKGIGDDPLDYTSTPPHPSGRYWQFADVNYTSVMIGDPNPEVTTGPRIWGSIFGGAEDGHVLGNDTVRLVKGLIGTKGTTTWDGNIFGGGRNYHHKNFSAGYTGGNVLVEMTGGQILGSIFGGGRLAITGISPLGIQRDGTSCWTYDKVNTNTGKIYVRVKGGVVGNEKLIEEWTSSTMGDVYGGGKGTMEGLAIYDNQGHPTHDPAAALLFSLARETHVIVSDSISDAGELVSSPVILGSIFGGGEVANVGNYGWTQNGLSFENIHLESDGKTYVTIDGGTIGATTVRDHENMTQMVPSKAQMRYDLVDNGVGVHQFDLKYNDDRGHVFGGGEGLFDDPQNYATEVNANPTGTTDGAHDMNLLDVMATVDKTEVTISGSAFVKGSVYGGSMNGHVLHDTKVVVAGGQIGAGYNHATNEEQPKYTEEQFFNPLNYATLNDIPSDKALFECYQWEYDSLTVRPFDSDSIKHKAGYKPTDGKTWFGNVFGGGSGFYPYYRETSEGSGVYKPYWNRDCGKVYGNSTVEIKGGHILTSVYGGSEMTDVGHFDYPLDDGTHPGGSYVSGGTATVTMSGGTLGVPRTLEQIKAHPVTCYLFGAGKGDPRDAFNTNTNIHYADVTVNGGTIYGSVFGGGEDAHIMGNAKVTIGNFVADAAYHTLHPEVAVGALVSPIIGTTGHSYVDGNIFGGGRGFTSEALTAGVVSGNVLVNIGGGTMLGSVYGGGRLAAVGTYLVPANNANYGRFMDDVPDNPETTEVNEAQYLHGHIEVNITGGTIGNDYESIYTHQEHTTGGNVYGGCMGRLKKVNGDINNRWPLFAVARTAKVKVDQATTPSTNRTTIRGTVYGGGEFGVIIDTTFVHVHGGTIWDDVYGAGRGSTDETEITYIDPDGNEVTTTALKRSARVVRNSHVLVDGGWIKRSVYGGGDLASVGSISNFDAHDQPGDDYAISWPFAFTFATGTGRSMVEVKGGRIGISGKDFMGPWTEAGIPLIDLGDGNGYVQYNGSDSHKKALKAARDDNGDIFGAGEGRPGDTWTYPHLANVNNSIVRIEYPAAINQAVLPENYKPYDQDFQYTCFYNLEDWPTYGTTQCITGSVYGGSENGHVNDSAYVNLRSGLVGHGIYGGGKGSGTYLETITPPGGGEPYDVERYCITAGKVFGNTHILIEGGRVVRSVFGGGNAASVGKANFLGYGETGEPIANNGRSWVEIKGGILGMLPVNKNKPGDVIKDNIPYGSVFGGARGFVDANCDVEGSEESMMSYVSSTKVIIGDKNGGPTLYGSVYGGGQDGHVRHTTDVTINNGTIGLAFVKPETAATTVGSDDPDSEYWVTRGNVFGGGSGISTYGDNDDQYSQYAGSVFETTNVTIKGGTIHRNVYGGGNLAMVGNSLTTTSQTGPSGNVTATGTNGRSMNRATVTIMGGNIGVGTDVNGVYTPSSGSGKDGDNTPKPQYFTYGGSVFGGGKGFESDEFQDYCTLDSTNVQIQGGNVLGEVYGGAENGHVVYDTRVFVNGGTIGTIGNTGYDGNVFGGGKGSGYGVSSIIQDPDEEAEESEYEYVTLNLYKDCGRVGGNTYVKVTDGYIKGSIYGGGSLALTGVNEEGEFPYDPQHPEQWAFADHGNTFITVKGTSTKIGTDVPTDLLHTDVSVGDIFGSGKGDIDNYDNVLAGRTTSTTVNVSESPTIYGTVFGGGEMAGVGWWGTDGQFFGNADQGMTGKTSVTINGSPVIGTAHELTLTHDANNPDNDWWTMFDADGKLMHTCTGNVFGGSQGDVYPKFGHWVSMGRSREAEVNINLGDNGLIRGTVYGGSEQGSVIGDTKVTVDGTGTIGSYITQGTGATTPYYFGGVFAGGYGSDDSTEDNDDIHPNDSTIHRRDVLHLKWTPAVMAGRVYGNAQADILGCTILGGVYGGGERAYVGYELSNTYGNVTVNIGSRSVVNSGSGGSGGSKEVDEDPTYTYSGNADLVHSDVFGANKYAGTPFGNTYVNVYQTAHDEAETEGNETPAWSNNCPVLPPHYSWTAEAIQKTINGGTVTLTSDQTPPVSQTFTFPAQRYAIHSVFGGGDRSHYVPHQSKHAHVHVYTCANTIEDLFGGSNAADIGEHNIGYETNANLYVDGGRFNRVFGGGNGLSAEHPANIHGKANTYIDGGLINQLFGGSNNYGTIHEINLDISENEGECPQYIYETFGGGNDAPHDGDVVVNVTCQETLLGHAFYGGANHGTINGNLTVNIMGGDFDYVFGGSKGDENHAADILYYTQAYVDGINAPHIDHIDEETGEPVYEEGYTPMLRSEGGNVTLNLYGGTIHRAAFGGCDIRGHIQNKITVNVIDTVKDCGLYLNDLYGACREAAYTPDIILDEQGHELPLMSPEVNVIHGTVCGNVYGGGQGASATVTSNPVVNIGFDSTEDSPMWQYIPASGVINVNNVANNAVATVLGDVYGGGDNAITTGSTYVNVRKDNTIIGDKLNFAQRYVTDRNVHQTINFGNVYGGGFGYEGNESSSTNVNYGKVTGNTYVTINGGTVRHNVYGGGRMASVGGTANVTVEGTALIGPKKADLTTGITDDDLDQLQTTLNLTGTLTNTDFINYSFKYLGGNEGSVYGAGRGRCEPEYNNFAYVNATNVTIGGNAQVVSGVFGGAENGRVETDTHVTIGRTGEGYENDAPIIGGIPYHAAGTYTVPAISTVVPEVSTINGEYMGVSRTISNDDSETKEDIYGVGTRIFRGGVFGGGRGTDTYEVNHIPTFNRTAGWVKGNSNVTINKGAIFGKVYGGGTIASVGTFQYYTYTPSQGGDPVTTDSISGYTSGTGQATVIVNGGQIGVGGINEGDVFGGGLGVAMQPGHDLTRLAYVGETDVRINKGAVVKSNVYGGAASGHVQGEAHVTVDGATIGVQGQYGWHGNVYGGGGGTERYIKVNAQGAPIFVNNQPVQHMSISAGRVFGSTYVTINQTDKNYPTVITNSVFGGGAAASVGGYRIGHNAPVGADAIIDNTVKCQVDITGGTIGVDGTHDDGMVYGAGCGFVKNPDNGFDTFSDSLTYAVQTIVNIGTKTVSEGEQPVTTYGGAAVIKGNVYGSGENGHVIKDATVNVYGGTVEGSVFGGGSGDEPYIVQNNNVPSNAYAPLAGLVSGDTYVNIYRGTILKNVYGGGELASLMNPYTSPDSYGTSNVTIEGGTIGEEKIGTAQELIDGGIVFGGCYGYPGDDFANYGNVGDANVTIKGGTIYNAVFGGGDNGHVKGNTVVAISEDNSTIPTIIGQKLTMRELIVDSLALARTHIYTGSVLAGGRGTSVINAAGEHSEITGRVYGNATVTVSGGTIRHAVYGGGGLASVGTYTLGNDGLPVFTSGGTTTVTVKGNALIGPKKDDLADPDDDELTRARVALGIQEGQTFGKAEYRNWAFRFLGLNEGWVFGAGCGLASNENGTDDLNKLTFNDKAIVNIQDEAQVAGVVFGGGENGRVMTSTEVNITGGVIGGIPLHGGGAYTVPAVSSTMDGEYKDVELDFPEKWSEIFEDEYGAGANAFRGSVFGGGKGSDTIVRLDLTKPEYRYSRMAGQVFGSTNVTISAGKIYGMVYGGGAISNVGKVTYDNNTGAVTAVTGGACNVTITGGILGSDNGEEDIDKNTIGLNNGNVFGGGLGRVGAPESSLVNVSYAGSTKVEVKNGAHVPGSVFGGPANGHVMGNSHVIIDGANTVIGTPGRGGWHSNVYGAGGGQHRYNIVRTKIDPVTHQPIINEQTHQPETETIRHLSITSGRVFGNTKIEIKNGTVLHNVYGGGAIASVGTYNISGTDVSVGTGTGKSEVFVTGGTIGTNGDNNGMVYGSARGLICNPAASAYPECFLDSLAYVANSEVTIGTAGGNFNDLKVNGSVYGGGENGHVYQKAKVDVYSGTIGCTASEFATATNSSLQGYDPTWLKKKFPYRGNVYGAGCGSEYYNPYPDTLSFSKGAGLVQGQTEVNIHGGYISRNVYGGGAMATVGDIKAFVERHKTTATPSIDSLSWPMQLTFDGEGNNQTGKAVVNIYGGHIGTVAAPEAASGNVFGSSRGKAADRYKMAYFANVREAHVNVNFDTAPTSDAIADGTANCIVGSVYGSGESGHVYESTFVDIKNGLIGGSVFGGGDGTELYKDVLLDNSNAPYPTNVRSITAGKVYGNTNVTISQASGKTTIIKHNVYGGGNLASVGKSNYFGYGEGGDESTAQNSGLCTVEITGGTIGTNGYIAANETVLNGFVFGSSKGTTYPTFTQEERYKYTRDFFLGYANSTNVTIGGTTVKGSVFGGGNDGHVRLSTTVNINEGSVIGVAYDPNAGLGQPTADIWKYRGNVYGAGRGIDRIASTNGYCFSAGSVTRYTTVNVNGGTIHNNVYGGGSLATVGPPTGYDDPSRCTVNIYNGSIGTQTDVTNYYYGGNVFGSSRGELGGGQTPLLNAMASAKETYVNIGNPNGTGNPQVYGSVFGGGDNGHVNTHSTVCVNAGHVGFNGESATDTYSGNVFGGGNGTDMITAQSGVGQTHNPQAGIVNGHTRVFVKGGTVHRDVYGGGNTSIVTEERVVTIEGANTVVKGDVYGGSNNGIDANTAYTSLKTVNVRGGQINGNVFGGSHNAKEGDFQNASTAQQTWNGFVNITGGTIGTIVNNEVVNGDVFAAGNGGDVTGSLCVNIGKGAVLHSPTYVDANGEPGPENPRSNQFYNVKEDGTTYDDSNESTEDDLPIGKLIIHGDVYGGSHHYGSDPNVSNWSAYDVNGFSVVFVDGDGYDTENDESTNASLISQPNSTTLPYMSLEKGIYGSGKKCESGQLIMSYGQSEARGVVIKDYGHRTNNADSQMTGATRDLTTIQRGGIVVLDNTNIHFTGAAPISRPDYTTKYAVGRANLGFYCLNGSGIVLGAANDPVLIDSVKQVKSMYLPTGESVYQNVLGGASQTNWETVGIMGNTPATAELVRLTNTGTETDPEITPETLTAEQENVILFKDKSKMYVRYTQGKDAEGNDITYYGKLQGFFRMLAEDYVPSNTEESFAYARPKLSGYPGVTNNETNEADGGFLSYVASQNYYSHGGSAYTNTKQYPYLHPYLGWRSGEQDLADYRLWVGLPEHDTCWYVDGRVDGWGNDLKSKKNDDAGLYPDKPKKTLFGPVTVDPEHPELGGNYGGIITDFYDINTVDRYLNFDYEKDIIFVVGALSAQDEQQVLRSVSYDADGNLVDHTDVPLKLFRYPGGHVMSNGSVDNTNSATTTVTPTWGATGNAGPGANYGAMLDVQAENGNIPAGNITLNNVVMDGLGYYTTTPTVTSDGTIPAESYTYTIPASYQPTSVIEPMIVTHDGSTLTLKGGTELKRGYNGTNADVWYTNADYAPVANVHHGGALYVDANATVNVEGKVIVTDNKQNLSGTGITSNVYLPTFDKSLTISGNAYLDKDTRIGVTSPIRKNESSYLVNTFSPVAKAATSGFAQKAWEQCNFEDDLGWFFVNGHNLDENGPRTTYYDPSSNSKTVNTQLYFGWTWANAVRSMPADYADDDINSDEDLAWLISKVNGMNGQTATSPSSVKLTDDIDLNKYVWLPIGTDAHSFSGSFDGQGHTVSNLEISFIGDGDRVYELDENGSYGLFGNVISGGTINRAFVVSGKISPVGSATIGGLAGALNGTAKITNSEAAVQVTYPDINDGNKYYTVGGLVGKMVGGDIHSSMAMPNISLNAYSVAGGLAGITQATTGDTPKTPSIKNSFANAEITVGNTTDYGAGGLVGRSEQLSMENCYSHNRVATTQPNYYSLVSSGNVANVQRCYGEQDFVHTGSGNINGCSTYTPVISSDELGYMYADNKIVDDNKTMFEVLNKKVYGMNKAANDSTYAHWARPALSEINNDLPVLLLGEFDGTANYQGTFRSVGTYAGGAALQYGGPVRDGNTSDDFDEVNAALTREKAATDDYLYIYGDVTENIAGDITQTKVSINEHASIEHPGALGKVVNSGKAGDEYTDTYVGITFDNSFGHAWSTPGVNGLGGQLLPRDWHMFSTPLYNAPMGFDYGDDNTATGPSNNPWETPNNEFSWLNNGQGRYWMSTTADGYFPTSRGTLFEDNLESIFVSNSDEHPSSGVYRYPYGMDLYAWYEPDYHWINFKRNGPNHWHSDENKYGYHDHLDYVGSATNVNEETLIPAKGYMASIATSTFLQSHGTLNAGEQDIALTEQGKYLKGWNLVGNPYHGYIDFDLLASNANNATVLTKNANNQPFYVVYDADTYDEENGGNGFLYQPKDGSNGGAYAGRYIHPHQGFYVKLVDGATANDAQHLAFTEDMVIPRSDVTESHFREWAPNYPLINLYLSSEHGCRDVTVIELERPEWGGAAKMKDLRVGNGLFYGHHEDDSYAAMFVKQGTERVPLRFEAKEDDIFTIKWETANGNFHSMYLIDNILGFQYDMIRNNSYTFEGHKDDYKSRFYIVFDVTDVEEHTDQPFVFFDGSEYVVTGDGDLEFIDVNGQILWRSYVSGQTRVGIPKVAAGVYMFRLVNSDDVQVQKVIVKK